MPRGKRAKTGGGQSRRISSRVASESSLSHHWQIRYPTRAWAHVHFLISSYTSPVCKSSLCQHMLLQLYTPLSTRSILRSVDWATSVKPSTRCRVRFRRRTLRRRFRIETIRSSCTCNYDQKISRDTGPDDSRELGIGIIEFFRHLAAGPSESSTSHHC